MHELSLAQNILDNVLSEARKHPAARVTAVDLRLGVISHVVPESLKFAFSVLAKDTAANGAELRIARVTGAVRCRQCGHEAEMTSEPESCARCGSLSLEVRGGRELELVSIEIEEDA